MTYHISNLLIILKPTRFNTLLLSVGKSILLSKKMNSKSSSLSSISDLFRPSNPRGLRSRDLSVTRLSVLKKEIQTDAHLIPLGNLNLLNISLYFNMEIYRYFYKTKPKNIDFDINIISRYIC